MKTSLIGFLVLLFLSGSAYSQSEQEIDDLNEVPELTWPREIDTDKGLVTIYQPQIDSYTANILEGRSAISYKPIDGEMGFGAFWFRAFLDVDKENRIASLDQIDILDLKFPGAEDSLKLEKGKEFIRKKIEAMGIVMSLDRLIASLDEAEVVMEKSQNLNNTPPKVYYRQKPTILVTIDGDPIWKEESSKNLKYCANSPFFIAQDLKSGNYYINGGDNWYVTTTPPTGWQPTDQVSKNIRSFAEENKPETSNTEVSEEDQEPVKPDIIVVTEPSELIVTDGEPDYQPIKGTNLLYVSNTESDIIMEIGSQQHYVLLAGRWYKAKQLSGDEWTFEEPEKLPEDFSKIPADSDMASVRVSVPGTDEANDALLEQAIPQTAEVSRADTKIEVKFDGSPKFKQIPNTEVSYALNSDKQILKINNKFYAVDNGIWFIADYPEGPYAVSDHRPEEVDQIPPEEPVYNTKYVYVYSTTPQVVYVGYLPGYTYAYAYGGVPVYGTGYVYPYWYGSVYYPRPVTYGFNVHYNPYTGWGFSFGISAGGWVGWGYHPYYRPYWGPAGYHTGYRHGYYHGYHHGYNSGYAAGYRRGMNQSQINNARNNVYRNQRTGVKSTRDLSAARAKDLSRPSSRPNNMYTDRKGNVYQRDKKGNYDQMNRPGGKPGSTRPSAPTTKPSKPNTKPTTRPSQPSTRPSKPTQPTTRPNNQTKQQFDRSYQNRQQGTKNYQQHRSTQQRSMQRSAPSRSMPSRGGRRR
jgi:hypothetical protein